MIEYAPPKMWTLMKAAIRACSHLAPESPARMELEAAIELFMPDPVPVTPSQPALFD